MKKYSQTTQFPYIVYSRNIYIYIFFFWNTVYRLVASTAVLNKLQGKEGAVRFVPHITSRNRRIKVQWDVTRCRSVRGSGRSEKKMQILRSFETSGTTNPATQRHSPQHFPQQDRFTVLLYVAQYSASGRLSMDRSRLQSSSKCPTRFIV